ncbi:hypothetical protein HOC01_01980 [archaeon]|nr:hypothetical protein [archaeon]MBT6697910.1 hypothetical protein [archaeon]
MQKKILLIVGLLAIMMLALSSCSSEVSGDPVETVEEVSEDLPVDESDLNTESSDVARASGVSQVVIEGMAYSSADITVNAGDTVEWINKDSVDHTVTFEDGRFDVEVPAGAIVSYTFTAEDELGEARYFCSFHPGMRGSVLVLE